MAHAPVAHAPPPPSAPLYDPISVQFNVLFVTASRLEWDEAVLAVCTLTPLMYTIVAIMGWVTGRRHMRSDDQLQSKTEATIALVSCAPPPIYPCPHMHVRSSSATAFCAAVGCSGAWRARRPHSTPASSAATERDRSGRQPAHRSLALRPRSALRPRAHTGPGDALQRPAQGPRGHRVGAFQAARRSFPRAVGPRPLRDPCSSADQRRPDRSALERRRRRGRTSVQRRTCFAVTSIY